MLDIWHHMLARPRKGTGSDLLCSKAILCLTHILGRLLFLWLAFVSNIEVSMLNNMCHCVGVCACQQKCQIQYVFSVFKITGF